MDKSHFVGWVGDIAIQPCLRLKRPLFSIFLMQDRRRKSIHAWDSCDPYITQHYATSLNIHHRYPFDHPPFEMNPDVDVCRRYVVNSFIIIGIPLIAKNGSRQSTHSLDGLREALAISVSLRSTTCGTHTVTKCC